MIARAQRHECRRTRRLSRRKGKGARTPLQRCQTFLQRASIGVVGTTIHKAVGIGAFGAAHKSGAHVDGRRNRPSRRVNPAACMDGKRFYMGFTRCTWHFRCSSFCPHPDLLQRLYVPRNVAGREKHHPVCSSLASCRVSHKQTSVVYRFARRRRANR